MNEIKDKKKEVTLTIQVQYELWGKFKRKCFDEGVSMKRKMEQFVKQWIGEV